MTLMSLGPVATNDAAYGSGGIGSVTLDVLGDAEAYNRWIVGFIRPRLGAFNIELGAGHGALCDIVGETHHVLPFELSEHNQAIVLRRFEGHTRVRPCRRSILEYETEEPVDCVYSANVLEHIEDDLAMIRHCARLLKPGGWFVAFVPAGKWLYSEFDRSIGHYRRYGRADQGRLAEVISGDARLVLREYRYVNVVGALGWFVKMRIFKQPVVNAGDAALVQRLLPAIRAIDSFRLPLGQSVVMALERIR